MRQTDWPEAYLRLAARIPDLARTARTTLCGMNACVDARTELHTATALLQATDPGAAALRDMLVERAHQGIGGEVRVEWPDGPAWLAAHVPLTHMLGGTGPQAARVLAAIGAPAVTALEDRSAHMMSRLPAAMRLFDGPRIVPAGEITPYGTSRGDIYIFDFSAGEPLGSVVPRRSSRVIVRLSDPGLEHDDAFERFSPELASRAGAGLISGFNSVPPPLLDSEIARVAQLCRRWRANGLDLIHLELAAGYPSRAALDQVLDAFGGLATSIGMSHAELRELTGEADLIASLAALSERLDIPRVCVHADEWVAAVTTGDPDREQAALMTGALLAAARAAAGRPVETVAVPPGASFAAAPAPNRVALAGGRSCVCCPAPYLERPASTLGLGDTFTAGCLLVLGAGARNPQDDGRQDAVETAG